MKVLSLLIIESMYLTSQAQNFVKINEFVVDPQQDRTEDGLITPSDEYFELYNFSDNPVNIDNWKIELVDMTPESKILSGVIPSKGYFLINNPVGAQNNDGEIRLIDSSSNIVDVVTYGDWKGSTIISGNSIGTFNESLSRYPNGGTNWVKSYATPGRVNMSEEKGLVLTISKINEGVKIEGPARAERKYILQNSDNLSDWANIYTNQIGERMIFEDRAVIGNKKKFYRAKEN